LRYSKYLIRKPPGKVSICLKTKQMR